MQPRKKTETENDRGFTLPELLIVMVLLGILAAIAIPSWSGLMRSKDVDSAANQFAADLRLANGRATNQLTDWRIAFKPDGSSFPCGAGPEADYYLVRLSSVYPGPPTPMVAEKIPRYFPGEVRITGKANFPNDTTLPLPDCILGDRATLEFNSDGSASVISGSPTTGESAVRVGVNGYERSVRITHQTSRVRVE